MSILASERESETVLTALPDIQTSVRVMAWLSRGKVAESEMRKQKMVNKSNIKEWIGKPHSCAYQNTPHSQKTLSAFKKCLITH